jgi:hypothetical protein
VGTSEELRGVGQSRRQLRQMRMKFAVMTEIGLWLDRRTQIIVHPRMEVHK